MMTNAKTLAETMRASCATDLQWTCGEVTMIETAAGFRWGFEVFAPRPHTRSFDEDGTMTVTRQKRSA